MEIIVVVTIGVDTGTHTIRHALAAVEEGFVGQYKHNKRPQVQVECPECDTQFPG